MHNDEFYMARAINLAKKADPSPNPRVGAVIAKGGKIIAEGFHKKAGMPHAEIEAFRQLKAGAARNSTLYVTLEPCSHWGRTPPCTDEIIRQGVSRVVFAASDPTKKVEGAEKLKKAGITVVAGFLSGKSEKLNTAFHAFQSKKLPSVSLKSAISLDGKIAANSGDSKWISSQESRVFAHMLRARNEAIIVGVGTILQDDPTLTVRLSKGPNPAKVVLDSHLRIPLGANVLKGGKVFIAALVGANSAKAKKLGKKGATILWFKGTKIDARELLARLAALDITSVLVEGGGEVNASFVQTRLVDVFYFFICPKIIGGRDAKSPVEGDGIEKMQSALGLSFEKVQKIGPDILIIAKPAK